MVFVDIFLILSLFLLTIPLVAGYYAHTRGRSFWLWFFMGLFFPVLAHFILALLPNKINVFEKELEELRLRLGVMGTVPDKTEKRKKPNLREKE